MPVTTRQASRAIQQHAAAVKEHVSNLAREGMSTTGLLRVQIQHLAELLKAKMALSQTFAELNTSNVDIEEHHTEVKQIQKEHDVAAEAFEELRRTMAYWQKPTLKFRDAQDLHDTAGAIVRKAQASIDAALAILDQDWEKIMGQISPLHMLPKDNGLDPFV